MTSVQHAHARLVPSSPPRPRQLTRAECRAWVADHDEARLGFDTGRGPRSVVVGYSLRGDEVVLVLPEYHPATGYVDGAAVPLEVEGPTAGGSWELVRALGVAYRGTASEAGAVRPYGAAWPSGVAAHTVHIPLARLEGLGRSV